MGSQTPAVAEFLIAQNASFVQLERPKTAKANPTRPLPAPRLFSQFLIFAILHIYAKKCIFMHSWKILPNRAALLFLTSHSTCSRTSANNSTNTSGASCATRTATVTPKAQQRNSDGVGNGSGNASGAAETATPDGSKLHGGQSKQRPNTGQATRRKPWQFVQM